MRLFRMICFLAALPLVVRGQEVRRLDQAYPVVPYGSLEVWQSRAADLRAHILVSAGLWPMPEPFHGLVHASEPLGREGYTVQNVAIETLPGFYLTGNVYRPAQGTAPFPAVLTAHGHWKNGRFENTDQASAPGRAINLARQGYVVFTYSMIGYNETADTFPHRFSKPVYELWGFSGLGLQLWNGLRALDYLSALPDVDAERIGMTGASGGATQTFLLAAVDPRIRVSVPVNMISLHMQGGCSCENAPLLRTEAANVEFGALTAPRPMLMVSTSGDWTKNTPEVEYPAVRDVYRLFGAADHLANVHLDYEHNYNRDSREAMYRWFGRWLRPPNGPAPEAPFTPEPDSVLSAVLPSRPDSIEEVFRRWTERSERQFAGYRPGSPEEMETFREVYGTALEHALRADVGSRPLPFEVLEPEPALPGRPAVLIVHPDGAEALARTAAEAHRAAGSTVFIFNPYPLSETPIIPADIRHPTTYNPTPAARLVSLIREAARQIRERPGITSLDVEAVGSAGPPALLARAFMPGIRSTRIDFRGFDPDRDEAYLGELFIPLLRRAGDFRTAVALIAPGRLSLTGAPEGPFTQWARDVYLSAGSPEKPALD